VLILFSPPNLKSYCSIKLPSVSTPQHSPYINLVFPLTFSLITLDPKVNGDSLALLNTIPEGAGFERFVPAGHNAVIFPESTDKIITGTEADPFRYLFYRNIVTGSQQERRTGHFLPIQKIFQGEIGLLLELSR
jgi:hypothetical protein